MQGGSQHFLLPVCVIEDARAVSRAWQVVHGFGKWAKLCRSPSLSATTMSLCFKDRATMRQRQRVANSSGSGQVHARRRWCLLHGEGDEKMAATYIPRPRCSSVRSHRWNAPLTTGVKKQKYTKLKLSPRSLQRSSHQPLEQQTLSPAHLNAQTIGSAIITPTNTTAEQANTAELVQNDGGRQSVTTKSNLEASRVLMP